MEISVRGVILIVVAVLANNLLWLYATLDHDMLEDEILISSDLSLENTREVNAVEATNQNSLTQDVAIVDCSRETAKRKKPPRRISSISEDINTVVEEESPIESPTIDFDVPVELSQDYLDEHAIDGEEYFYADSERKLDIIQSLSAQGDDLELIREVLKTEDDSNIRIAALTRLTHEHSFAATNTLIEALDDPVEEVALAALNAIVVSGDRSVLPMLNEKKNTVSNGVIRNEYEKLIHRLEYSVTMGMDEILAD